MKKAFTLIELLVVIAIIAILAAILFPVFAQAKLAAKKTGDLSNLKQLNTSIQIYLADYDDTCPLTIPGNLGTSLFTMPSNRTATTNPGVRDSFYGNSIHPYVKSWQMFNGPAATNTWEPFGAQTPKPIVDFGYTMNTYLGGWTATASENPAMVVSYWNGLSNYRIPGFGVSYPLYVTADVGFLGATSYGGQYYTFKATGASCVSSIGYFGGTGPFSNGAWKENTFGRGANMAYLDGHAKFAKFGGADYPYVVNADGSWGSYWVADTFATDGCGYSYTLNPLITN